MNLKISSALVITVCLFTINTIAQEHTNSWFKTTLSIPLSEKLETDVELQHRRQNDFESTNLFDKNLMNSVRTWIYYKQSEDVVYGISPFAYFSNYKIIQTEHDANEGPSGEYRFTAMIELQHELTHKLFIVDRSALEYRVFEGTNDNVVRFRTRLALRYDFTPKFNMSIGDEIFINAAGTDTPHIFDHDRLYSSFAYKPNHNLKLETGYIHISRLPKNNVDLLEESNVYLNFTYILPKRKSHDI